MLNLEESRYALSKILEVLNSPWQPGINYDNLKAAADRHQRRIDELELRPTKRAADGSKALPIVANPSEVTSPFTDDNQ